MPGLAAGHSPRRDEGAVGLVAVVGGLIVAALAVAMITAAAGVGVAAARARVAADAAALAAMGASPLVSGMSGHGEALPTAQLPIAQLPTTQGEPEREAARVATANGARLIGVDADGWPFRVRVTVEVQPRHGFARVLMPPLRAHATAAARPSARMR